MSYTREQIQAIITRNKKRNTSKSPTGPLSPKSTTSQANRNASPKDIAMRYQQLCSKYKQLLEQVKDKNHKFQIQQTEMQRMIVQRQRDQKELLRLRSMIGFIKKQDKSMQVNMDMQSGGSWSTKIQKSTTIDYQPQFQWSTPVKLNQSPKIIRKRSPNSKQYQNVSNNLSTKYKKTHIVENVEHYLQQNEGQAYGNRNEIERIRTQSIYSPKSNERQLNTILKTRESRKLDDPYSKLSNSPYSKLRFSRNQIN